jgi:uncharacterized protein (DUF736 family)
MMIGKFKPEGDGYTGQLDALGLTVSCMTFCPVKDKQGGGPDFIIYGYGDHPEDPFDPEANTGVNTYEVGAAWKKTSRRGRPYLSVKLDGPTLAAAIQCALTEQTDGSYHLIWRRKDDEAAASEQAAA